MENLDIAQLVRGALLAGGCTPGQIGHFDSHSTIQLDFEGIPSVNIAHLDSGVWLWSAVTEFTPAIQSACAEPLLEFLMKGFGPARTSQFQVTEVNGMLELRVLLGAEATESPEAMSEALEGFITALDELQELLRR